MKFGSFDVVTVNRLLLRRERWSFRRPHPLTGGGLDSYLRIALLIGISLFAVSLMVASSPADTIRTDLEHARYVAIRNLSEKALSACGIRPEGTWSVSVGPERFHEIGLHTISALLTSSGASTVIEDSGADYRLSVEILEELPNEARFEPGEGDAHGLSGQQLTYRASVMLSNRKGIVKCSDVFQDTIQAGFAATFSIGNRPGQQVDTERSFWDRLLVPFAVVGAVGVAIFLLFHVRS